MRLTSGVFMVRGVTKDTTFEMEDGSKFNIRAGDRIAMYPPAIHKDPEIYEDPLVGIFRQYAIVIPWVVCLYVEIIHEH